MYGVCHGGLHSQVRQAEFLSTPGAGSSSGSVGALGRPASPASATPTSALHQPPAAAHQATLYKHVGGPSILLAHSAAAEELAAATKGSRLAVSGSTLPSEVEQQQRPLDQGGAAIEAAAAAVAGCSQPAVVAAEPVPAPALESGQASTTGGSLWAGCAADGLQGQPEDALEARTAEGADPIPSDHTEPSGSNLPLPRAVAAASGVSSNSTAARWQLCTCGAGAGRAQQSVREAGVAGEVAGLPPHGSSTPAGASMAACSSIPSGNMLVQGSRPSASTTARRAEVASAPQLQQDTDGHAGPPGFALAAHEHSAPEEHGTAVQRAGVHEPAHAAELVLPAAATAEGAAVVQGSQASLTVVTEQPLVGSSGGVRAPLSQGDATEFRTVKQVNPTRFTRAGCSPCYLEALGTVCHVNASCNV